MQTGSETDVPIQLTILLGPTHVPDDMFSDSLSTVILVVMTIMIP